MRSKTGVLTKIFVLSTLFLIIGSFIFIFSPISTDVNSDRQQNRRLMIDEKLVQLLKFELYKLSPHERGGCKHLTTLAEFVKSRGRKSLAGASAWEKFYNQLDNCELYRETSADVEQLLKEMNELPITRAKIQGGGTRAKLALTFENGKRAIFKPQRFTQLNQETLPNHFYFTDYERSFAEIAAFHLDRLLGFRRALPTIGRIVDLNQIKNVSDTVLRSTFFKSPANMDRHEVKQMKMFGQESFLLHLDHGRGFGKASEDYIDILAPLYQCCVIRPTTVSTLLRLYTSPISLGQMLKLSLSRDPTFPILADQHYPALDRRLAIVMKYIQTCMDNATDVHDVMRNVY